MKQLNIDLRALLLVGAALVALQGCGSGSGASVEENPITQPPVVNNYAGPPPATADVQSFKLNVWDNLIDNNRCGGCHNDTQVPRFVRSDDINLAYEAANTIVDLTDPALSLMVTKVRNEGHNCWLTSDDACADILETFITNWAGATLGEGKQIQLIAPELTPPGESKNFPADSGSFASLIHTPILLPYCSGCHSDAASIPQSPLFAGTDVDAAYDAAKAKIDIDTPSNSRLVLRLRNDSHNCWANPFPNGPRDCVNASAVMEQAITAFANGITPDQIPDDVVTSMQVNLEDDGIVTSSGGRFEANVVALYEFKTGNGNTVFDTSGVEPALNLTLEGVEETDFNWVGGWGVQLMTSKAQGQTGPSAKLRNLIANTGEYSIEAWVAPANVVQDGPARIVAYSAGQDDHNFILGQTLYQYDYLNRSEQTDQAGEPRLSTDPDAEDLQATLQHVVAVYDPVNGRRVYVNGNYTGDADPSPGGLLTDWNDTYALVLGSEVDGSNPWAGTFRLLAIHNRALNDEQIRANYDAGVGEKFYLLFNVTEHVGIDDAYVVFEVSQFDSYAYLFNAPFFIILSEEMPGTIEVQNMRIGINGREARVGQTFATLNMTINDADYGVEGFQQLSDRGAVIALDQGPDDDEFFLTFERLGDSANAYVDLPNGSPVAPVPVARTAEVGLRTFAEVNATMAELTAVTTDDHPQVLVTYNEIFQSLPVSTSIANFLSSQQMGVTQLAIQYCNAWVDGPSNALAVLPSFTFGDDAPADYADRTLFTDPMVEHMLNTGVATQADVAATKTEVDNLITQLIACPSGCGPERTEQVAKAACTAVLGSAAMLVQ